MSASGAPARRGPRTRLPVRVALSAAVLVAGLPGYAGPAAAREGDRPMLLRTVAGSGGNGEATGLAQHPDVVAYRDGTLYTTDGRKGRLLRALDLATGRQRLIAGDDRPRHRGEGDAATVELGFPYGFTVDAGGRVWFSDSTEQVLTRVDPDGRVVVPRFLPDPLPTASVPARQPFWYAHEVAAAPNGSVYAATRDEVYELTADGRRRLVVGGGGTPGCSAGRALFAHLEFVSSLAVDGAGRLLVSANDCVRRLERDGGLTVVAGGVRRDFHDRTLSPDGPAVGATLRARYVAADGDDVYVVDEFRIRRVRAGTITTVAGDGSYPNLRGDLVTAGDAGDGQPATWVAIRPGRVAAHGGRLWFVDHGAFRIRVVDNGVMGTVAGNGQERSGGDGEPAVDAQVFEPAEVAALPGGGYVVTEPRAHRLRIVGPDGRAATLAGNGVARESGDGGPARAAELVDPSLVAVGPDGSIFVANHRRVRRIHPDGVIRRFAGADGTAPAQDGVPATESTISVSAMDAGPDGSLYLVSGYSVRRVRPDGIVETIAGGNGYGSTGDGGPARDATFTGLTDVDVDAAGGYYVTERGGRVRYVTPEGIVTTVAGGGSPADGRGDGGPATAARLFEPRSVTLADDGALYVGEPRTLREVRDGVIRTVAGSDAQHSTGGGDVAAATSEALLGPGRTSWSPDGLLIPEAGADRVRLLTYDVPPPAPSPMSATPSGSGRMTVRWTAPAPNGGSAVESYTVVAELAGGVAGTRTVPATERATTLTGLRNGSTYTFRVHATNGAGAGPPAWADATVRPDPPRPPIAVHAYPLDGSAEVAWTPAGNAGQHVAGYRVTALPGGASVEVAAGETSTVVGGLRNGRAYRFTVAARTHFSAWGTESEPSAVVVPDGAPIATFRTSAALAGESVVTFSEPVRDVNPANVVLTDRATGEPVAAGLVCRTTAGGPAVCAEDAVRTVAVRPRAPLTAGASYDLTVNPDGARPVVDLSGLAVPPSAIGIEASRSEPETTAGGRRSWRLVDDSRADRGQYAVERQPGAVARARVTGTRVTWLTALGPNMGRAELWVDGVRRGTYDNRARTGRWRYARTLTGLANTAHTVEVRVLGGGSVVVDSLGAPAAYEWRLVGATPAAGGTYAVAHLAGAEATFTFRGTSVAWDALRGPGYGRVAVYVDGVRRADVDYYAATTSYGYRRTVGGLAPGVHTVRLVVLGRKSAAATGTAFGLDHWQVTG